MSEPDAKAIERARYNSRSLTALATGAYEHLAVSGAIAVPVELRRPYLYYEAAIRAHAGPSVRVLDLCCGDGLHSLTAARCGAEVTATDLAEHALQLAAIRAGRAGLTVRFVVADAEALPFADNSFEVATCAGGLSYVQLERFLGELKRVLCSGGAFIFVDSLNHNPIYRFNRWWHHCRGRRSRATLERMPTLATLGAIRTVFPDLVVSYYGIFTFLAPVLRRVAGGERAARWLDHADKELPRLRRFAFKVAGVGHLPAR